ncbi:MAG: chemotaxis protein CheX [Firmicutes bacterium]|nr:chemotaxis protein CheX [Bacillota bacterium]
MKADVINSFIKASMDVIQQTTGVQPKLGKAYRKTTPYKSNSMVVLIGLTGDLQGNVAITMDLNLACNIASMMMGGVEVTTLDEMAKSAVAELGNMILGNTGILLAQIGIRIDVTPPTILTGEKMELSNQNALIIGVPLLFDGDQLFELNISYRVK